MIYLKDTYSTQNFIDIDHQQGGNLPKSESLMNLNEEVFTPIFFFVQIFFMSYPYLLLTFV